MKFIESLHKTLVKRPFHSEADLQHALAWEIQQSSPKAEIRLEIPLQVEGKFMKLDLLVRDRKKRSAIELKYKTIAKGSLVNGEAFNHRSSGAQPQVLFDFIKDVSRIESLLDSGHADVGYAVLVTSEKSYLETAKRVDTVKYAFSVHQGHELSGILKWPEGIAKGTRGSRADSITLRGKYKLNWLTSQPLKLGVHAINYLTIQVRKGS